METISVVLALLVLAVVVAAIVAGVVLHSRKRQHARPGKSKQLDVTEAAPVEEAPAAEPLPAEAIALPATTVEIAPVEEVTLPVVEVTAPDRVQQVLSAEEKLAEERLSVEQALAVQVIVPVEEGTQQEVEERPSKIGAKTRRLEPVKHGGRLPGSQEVKGEKPEIREKKPHVLKPELVCWRKTRKWFIGIETPEEYEEHVGLAVTQDGVSLTQDGENRWTLLQISGTVCISWNEVESPIEINLDKPYLLFRLAGESINRGRRVRYATTGRFLVIVPDQWQRDEQVSGPAPISPENVAIAGHQAHYFLLDRDSGSKIGFLLPGGNSESIPIRASCFELTGTCLPDASRDIGPLFGEGPPRIRALDRHGWNSVKTIVVGQEGWRTGFTPEPDRNEQCLPTSLREKRGGWYFIRFYDPEDNLVESADFRFVSALKGIRVSPHSPLPGVNGHSPARVEFLHDTDCTIELSNPPADNLLIEREDAQTTVTIPPAPIWDETCWTIHAEGGVRVETRILIERVWWTIEEEGVEIESAKWMDVPISVSRGLVTATSKHAIRFRLPRCRWTSEVFVGFERRNARAYAVEVVKREVSIPLRDLEGMQEIEDRGQEHLLKLWIKEGTGQDMSVAVAVIPATRLLPIRQSRGDVRRARKYLRRLGRRTRDPALRELIGAVRARWSVSTPEADSESCRIEAACVILLTWEVFRENGVKPLAHRKRWIRKLIKLALAHPETMQGIREDYEVLRHSHAGIVSRAKR